MFRLVAVVCVIAIGLAIFADVASAGVFRRSNCSSGCSTGCGVSGSQGCNISTSSQPVRATADDLLQQASLPKRAKIAPPSSAPDPVKIDSEAALAFCAPVAQPKHRLDLEKVVYRPISKAPLSAVASR